MSRAASYSSVSGQPRTFAIAGSLLLVSVSYVLLLSAPVITRHLRSVVSGVGGVKAFEWLPLACGAGLVLGGASALVFVLTQIAREAERRPYVCLAPVLAAFAACILIGLRAELPLKGVASEHVAVFGLALSVIGGSLVQTSRVSAQMMGLGFTFLPPLSLFVMLWTLSGKVDPAQVVWGLSASARAFLGMLTLSSFAIAAVATLGRQTSGGLSARIPRDQDNYVLYELEDDLLADEARMRQRGLPGWLIVLAAAAAVALGFMALKVFLERRAALNFLAPSKPISAPASSLPGSAAPPASAPAPTLIEPSAPEPSAPEPSAPAPSNIAPAVVPAVSDDALKTAPEAADEPRPSARSELKAAPEQPVRAEIAPQAAAPEAARAAAAKPHGSTRTAHKVARPERKAVHAAARAQSVAKPAPTHVEKPAPVQSARVEKSVEKSAPAEAPKLEAKPVEAKKPTKPQSVADLAVQAASLATPSTRPSKSGQEAKPASSELDELMDNVLKPEKGNKKQKANDDPIYGL